MGQVKLNLLVNIFSFFAFLISTITGLILWQVLPGRYGFRGERSPLSDVIFLWLARHDWLDLHNLSSIIFVVLVAVHLILHRRWIKNAIVCHEGNLQCRDGGSESERPGFHGDVRAEDSSHREQ